jgi:hypothetical protein
MRTHALFPRLLAAFATAALGACAGNGDGLDANGQPIQGPAPPVQDDFTQIQDTIFTPICTACHIGATAPLGLRLDAANSRALLVGIASVEVPALLRVSPGNPDASYLVQKIEGTAAVGERMPLGGPPLPQAQIDLVRGWIAAGAPPPASLEGSDRSLRVTSVIPDPQEEGIDGTREITVVFNAALDASLVAPTVTVVGAGGDGHFEEGNEYDVRILAATVPLINPNVLRITVDPTGPRDTYRLIIRGSSPLALADVHGRVLEKDFVATFQPSSEGAR